jgi:hypothetical protein
MRPRYAHVQVSWTSRLLFIGGAALALLLPPYRGSDLGAEVTLAAVVLVLLVAGLVFSRLTVRIEGDALHVAFGLGWPRRVLPLADISAIEATRTRWFEGWGIRSTARGWLWNVAGFDAVLLRLAGGKTLLVGTDEPQQLLAALARAGGAERRP